MDKSSYFLALFNATTAGILYAIDSRGWVLQVLIMILVMVDSIVKAIKEAK
jgi:hypothetical protein